MIDVIAAVFDAELFESVALRGQVRFLGGYTCVADQQFGHRALRRLAELAGDIRRAIGDYLHAS
ncbi:MAG: hypothetical protein ABI775_12065 [Pseudonocardiales bacterium]